MKNRLRLFWVFILMLTGIILTACGGVDELTIKITPNSAEVGLGKTAVFEAVILLEDKIISKDVTWSVLMSDSGSNINSKGVLTVAANERCSYLIVQAVSKFDQQIYAEATVIVKKPLLLLMVQIPSGTFTMGSPESEADRDSDETRHQVTISKGFYMGMYEVTQEQYRAVTGVNPSYFGREPAAGEAQSKRPVENVTWYDAVEFCNKLSALEGLTSAYTITGRTPASGYPITSATVTVDWNASGYRLPTEAEWEYACRAGTTTAYNTGNTISDNTGWYYNNSNSRTHEVGKKPPNAWGLHDMHGNVFEWCWDWYWTYASGAQTDPTGAASGSYRVGRGGSGNFLFYGEASHSYSYGQHLRSAYRRGFDPGTRNGGMIGFRLLRPLS